MYNFQPKGNRKTGPIPTTRSPASTCPDSCGLKGNGCYAENTPLVWAWDKDETRGISWDELLMKIRKIPAGSLWRHNEAGDLPQHPLLPSGHIDTDKLSELQAANKGRRGFTYTHYEPEATHWNWHAISYSNIHAGFTINVSADNVMIADRYVAAGLPTVVVLPMSAENVSYTPVGNKIVACPAEKSDRVTCATCGLCQIADRPYIIGFRAHGTRKKTAERVTVVNL